MAANQILTATSAGFEARFIPPMYLVCCSADKEIAHCLKPERQGVIPAMLFATLMLLVGIAIGQRVTVVVLPPAILLMLLLLAGVRMRAPETIGAFGVTAVAAIACLQVGYLLGAGIRVLIASARASGTHERSAANSSPMPPARRDAGFQRRIGRASH
jgi:hypothetical protein